MTGGDPLERYEGEEVEIRLTNDEHVVGILDTCTESFFVLTGEGESDEPSLGGAQRNHIDGERSFNVDHVVSIERTG